MGRADLTLKLVLDKWKEQLPHDDLKPPPSQFYESATIPTATAAVTPSHVFPLKEEATTSDSATNITDPPQVRNVKPSESGKHQYPVLSEVAPRVLHRNRECMGGMDMDQIHTDACFVRY